VDVKRRNYIILLLLVYSIGCVHGQKNKSFSGELIYHIEKVDANPNELLSSEDEEEKMIIYARDSLLKIVNFNSANGIQECLKHLIHNKSILLLEIDGQGYAVRIESDLNKASDSLYSFKKKCGFSRNFKGLKSKKILMKHPMLSNDLICLYSSEISAKYASVFSQLPGLPILYYLVSEKGLLNYTLESYKKYVPPLSVFMIPEGYQILSMEEFLNGMKNSDN
jgi:hypothetical protein